MKDFGLYSENKGKQLKEFLRREVTKPIRIIKEMAEHSGHFSAARPSTDKNDFSTDPNNIKIDLKVGASFLVLQVDRLKSNDGPQL